MDLSSPRTMNIPPEIAPDGVVSIAALNKVGVTTTMVTRRCRAGGPWRRLLPGVVQLGSGPPTRRQLLRAAVMFAGPCAVITGVDALQSYGIDDLTTPHHVRLLVPVHRRLGTKDFVTVERTTRLPQPVVRDSLPFAPGARAAIDIARTTSDLWLLRSSLALAVLYGLCTKDDLADELAAGNQRGSATVRLALKQIDATAAGLLHRHAMRLLLNAPLPPPQWNVTIYDRRRRPMGYADAWWDEVGLAWQLGPPHPDAPAPAHGHLALTAAGVIVVRTAAEDVREALVDADEREPIVRELVAAFAAASARDRPAVEARCPVVPNTA